MVAVFARRGGLNGCRGEFGKDREYEGCGFSGAGLRDTNEIVIGQDLGDRGGLDRGGLGVTGFLNCFKNIGPEAQFTE